LTRFWVFWANRVKSRQTPLFYEKKDIVLFDDVKEKMVGISFAL